MSENTPSMPSGAVPPKPPEASKVQPKKETVRINLPPKPSAAPTIKLPTLPPGGPSGGPSAAPPAPALSTAAAAPPPPGLKRGAPSPGPPPQRPSRTRRPDLRRPTPGSTRLSSDDGGCSARSERFGYNSCNRGGHCRFGGCWNGILSHHTFSISSLSTGSLAPEYFYGSS